MASRDLEPSATEVSDDTADGRVVVVVGGVAAGYAAAATLREEGYRGRVVMIDRENRLPYDRPNLSKDYLAGHAQPEWMPLRPDEFYDLLSIEVLRGREVGRRRGVPGTRSHTTGTCTFHPLRGPRRASVVRTRCT